ncbi:hypothetical protein GON03_19260 [Nocardioides sp. MAH-18]|uniref:Uncharacterized protein n=1 Tax=Nocardioides agri TaxID=2682843 RepID=A0A6L6XVC1_9ACTN|nr:MULTISPECIES: hypothetical protein [unclassified Nocardioides]MBA2952158.1 hypothetical protein [Nocardioides sp. CGMCC 1.13656]MVQ51324.1 hypothetical protein [Nocardioides sp. MAH-18]
MRKSSTARSTIARIAANERWAKTEDRSAATQPARDAMARKFEDQVDPDRVLPAAERAKRAENAKRAHYQRIALKSAQARRAKKSA